MPIPNAVKNFSSNVEDMKIMEAQAEIQAEILANEQTGDSKDNKADDENYRAGVFDRFDDSPGPDFDMQAAHNGMGYFNYY